MDKKLEDAIEKIKRLSEKDAEFDAAMRKLFGKTDSALSVSDGISSSRMDEIYEYCIEKVLREQSEQFYKYFPIKEIAPQLVEDFCRMERYKREDNFEDFCLATFQQVECVTNWFCQRPKFVELCSSMMDKQSTITDYEENIILVGNLIIQYDYENRCRTPLIQLYFNERIRAVLYFVYFNKKTSKYAFDTKYNELNELYQCRNLNHRGGIQNQYQKDIIANIIPYRYNYYLKFTGLLVDYVEHVSRFMSKKEDTGIITTVLPSAVFVKLENDETIEISGRKLWYKVKGCKKGDKVIVERNGMTGEINSIKTL